MSLLDTFTGGKSDSATDALKRAEEYFANIKTPTVQELTLPELQKYVEAGVMTPQEAQAYLQSRNAYEDMNIDQTGTSAQVAALNRLAAIADAGAEGTPMQQAQMENTLSRMRSAVGGQRGAIEQAMAARGTPYALIQAALANQSLGQEQQQAHLDAVNAQAATYQNALNALSQGGQLGNALQGQQNQQANTVAAAANAMQQFNAQNQQLNSQFNAGQRQSANSYNAQNRQNVSNQNVGLSNQRTQYNTQLPQQVFANQMAKAQGMAGAATNIGNLYQQQGQQNAGLNAGIINSVASFIPKPGYGAAPMSAAYQAPNNPTTNAFNQSYQQGWYAHGGIVDDPAYCAADGMMIPGDPEVPGDSVANDNVPIMASPGEAVIPRSTVAENPEVIDSLLNKEQQGPDFRDVATLLKAMKSLRLGVA